MDFLKKLGASTWAAVKPIAAKPHTWVVLIVAVGGYLGKQYAPDTVSGIADIIANIAGGLN